jgi:hypothetical protein
MSDDQCHHASVIGSGTNGVSFLKVHMHHAASCSAIAWSRGAQVPWRCQASHADTTFPSSSHSASFLKMQLKIQMNQQQITRLRALSAEHAVCSSAVTYSISIQTFKRTGLVFHTTIPTEVSINKTVIPDFGNRSLSCNSKGNWQPTFKEHQVFARAILYPKTKANSFPPSSR